MPAGRIVRGAQRRQPGAAVSRPAAPIMATGGAGIRRAALKVKHIVVLGHAHCGGIRPSPRSRAAVARRLHRPLDVADRAGGGKVGPRGSLSREEYMERMEKASIVNTLDNLMTFPRLRNLIERGAISCTAPISASRRANFRCWTRRRASSARSRNNHGETEISASCITGTCSRASGTVMTMSPPDDSDLDLAQPRPWIARMEAGADVELEAVPRADHVHLVLENDMPLLVRSGGDDLLDLGDHLALAGRPAHVRAMVEVGEELAAELEHRDLEVARSR